MELYSPLLKEKIEELTEKATQERKIENELIKLEKIWSDINFETNQLALKDGPVDLLKMNDDHLELLDEHQLLVQSLASNKYLAYYEERVLRW